jgi:predicted amidophosphoribosyltransferase
VTLPTESTRQTPWWREALRDAAALVAPINCAGCGAADRVLCHRCAAAIVIEPWNADLVVGVGVTLPLIAATAYHGVTRAALLALKESGHTELAAGLAPALAAALERAYAPLYARGALLVPVPGTQAAFGRRGFHPVDLVARRAGLQTYPALRIDAFPRGAASQKQRSLAERVDRPEPRVTRPVSGHRVVLVDDVVTSGATLRSATRALTRAGATVVGAAAIAATEKRRGESAIAWRTATAPPPHSRAIVNSLPPTHDN